MKFDGVINVLKPPGMTSFDVIAHLRSLTGRKTKLGHTGTLDPLAAGVLPVCAGSATRAIEYLVGGIKKYRAEMTLGITTDTLDSSGAIITEKSVDIQEADIIKALSSLSGTFMQMPPAYSAIRIGGKRLYEMARNGVDIERPTRQVTIYENRLLHYKGNRVIFETVCSKGTYIRSLCDDAGKLLGCGAHMSFLVRLASGKFSIESSKTLKEIKEFIENDRFDEILQPVDKYLDFDSLSLEEYGLRAFLNGNQIDYSWQKDFMSADKLYKVYNPAGVFIGIGKSIEKSGRYMLKPEKLIGATV